MDIETGVPDNNDFLEFIKNSVNEKIKLEVEKVYEKELANIMRSIKIELEDKKNEVVAGAVIGLSKSINFDSIGERLTITIRKEEHDKS